jgi:hypothetical protein
MTFNENVRPIRMSPPTLIPMRRYAADRLRIVGSSQTGDLDVCLLGVLVFQVGPITRPEKSYRAWCVHLCDREASMLRHGKY